MVEKDQRSSGRLWLWRGSLGALVFASVSALGARESSAADKEKNGSLLSTRFAVEGTYGQWSRSYEGELALPGRAARFAGAAREETFGWRGRVDVIMGPDHANFRGKVGPFVEGVFPVEHSVEIAGSAFRFQSAPILVGANVGFEARFFDERMLFGGTIGMAHVFERIEAPQGTVASNSTKFALPLSIVLGYRQPLSEVIAVGATVAAEYQVFIAATRFSGGLFLEVRP